MLIDTHCHLDYKAFHLSGINANSHTYEALVERAHQAGVGFLINVGFDVKSSLKGLNLAQNDKSIFCALGVHPNESIAWEAGVEKQFFQAIEADWKVKSKRIVAIGEIGLDYFRNKIPKSLQKKVFRGQLNLAKKVQLPVIIHCREAFSDVVEILEEEGMESVVFHCFSEGLEQAKQVWRKGWITSFTAVITYPKNSILQEVVKACPETQYFLETDAPFLPPQSLRGKLNESAFMIETAQAVADFRGQTLDQVAYSSTRNARRFFGFPLVNET
ncbi:MAG: TatD family hydrolase, TatD DNase family protein [Candidatus Peregrinibacteria bacterium GW2011_GWE2_39_6]|nr:MAG: TatD family hydrolase, TatD DNase family protein [Candidatus Peregrinibacteria bacterium GW2011_GWF2_39_17]KKR26810.1 MAG: TatD family hydrolase, TatD DNase family protein [Candidatus Peregrinibacteria bacterium GW2011_GWE2_39_6]HCW32881.1 hypothetical protein [Candidatus Peregrinibacteria bacterium]